MTSDLDRAISRLRSINPRARYFRVAEIPAGRVEGEQEDQSFQYVSLYDHHIGTSILPVGRYLFIIANGFLSSHAYNIALSWAWRRTSGAGPGPLAAALRHNYKKVFAECVLNEANCLMGRAMLIETLMYEQNLMQPMFDAVAADPALGRLASDMGTLMTDLTSHHELAHYFIRRGHNKFRDEAAALFGGALHEVMEEMGAEYGEGGCEEVLCDGVAASLAVSEQGALHERYGVVTCARMTAFAFMVFSDLISLEESARFTARNSRKEDEAIDLSSEKRIKTPFSFSVGRRRDVDARADKVVKLLDAHLRAQGKELFGDEGAFPLPRSAREELDHAFGGFGEEMTPLDGGLTGVDRQRRGLAQLLAEALHGYEEGAEFLLWRSKRFSVGGVAVDP